MSRILRRPMFRGGSTSNEGIMSVPRKGYANGPDENGVQSEDTGDEVSSLGSIDQTLAKELLSGRTDPLGKFLINFGLDYASRTPRKGKFGLITTAAESAKKPTEQLYSDIETDKLFKLKLYSAMGKKESKGSFEKRVLSEFKFDQKLPQGQRRFKSVSDAAKYVSQLDILKKGTTPEERIAAREKSYENDPPGVRQTKAEIFEIGIPKLGKERKNVDLENPFVGDKKNRLIQKPNSTDLQFSTPPQNMEKKYEINKIYVDINSRNAYRYVGPNTFRFFQSLE